MDTSELLIIHSYFRWVVLVAMLLQGIWIWRNYKSNTIINTKHIKSLLIFTIIYNIQLILGWSLYLNSMIVEVFWKDVSLGIKNRQLRFFGLEHMSMMTLAIILINYSTIKAYKGIKHQITFKYLLKTYLWIYLIILSSIPWSFSPLTSRPDFR